MRRLLGLVVLVACSSPVEPAKAGPLNARLSQKPGVLSYDLDYASACKLTAYDWDTGFWQAKWDLPVSRGGRVQIGREVDTYFHLLCSPVVDGDETNWHVLLVRRG